MCVGGGGGCENDNLVELVYRRPFTKMALRNLVRNKTPGSSKEWLYMLIIYRSLLFALCYHNTV